MVWCNTTRTDTIDFGILGHTTNNGSEQPYETLSKIIRHDQVLVVWNAPVPTTGRFPGSQLNTHKIAFPVSKNQWLPCPSGMRIIQCSLLTVTRSRRSSTCFPFNTCLLFKSKKSSTAPYIMNSIRRNNNTRTRNVQVQISCA